VGNLLEHLPTLTENSIKLTELAEYMIRLMALYMMALSDGTVYDTSDGTAIRHFHFSVCSDPQQFVMYLRE
jgi:hypothetical protein